MARPYRRRIAACFSWSRTTSFSISDFRHSGGVARISPGGKEGKDDGESPGARSSAIFDIDPIGLTQVARVKMAGVLETPQSFNSTTVRWGFRRITPGTDVPPGTRPFKASETNSVEYDSDSLSGSGQSHRRGRRLTDIGVKTPIRIGKGNAVRPLWMKTRTKS